jgi:lambda repressor-like predicted transcriptional regulator
MMHHEQIKAAVRMQGVNLADVAQHAGYTTTYVSRVIRGLNRNDKIAEAIAGIVGKDKRELWPKVYAPAPTVKSVLKKAA